MMSAAGVLLVSPDPSLDDAYRQALSARGQALVCVPGAAEAVRALLTFRVQAIVLDSRLGPGCVQLQRWLLADPERAQVPVLYLVSAAAGDPTAAAPIGFRPDTDAVLPRPFTPSQLAEAVAALARPSGPDPSGERARAGPFSLDLRRLLSAGGRSVALTPIEGRLLHYLMERQGAPVPVEELLVRVWGYHPGTGAAEVVRAHVRNLRRKLRQLMPGRDVLLSVPRRGYRFVGDESGSPG